MANTKISALASGNPAVGTDEIAIARAGANNKLTLAQLVTLASASPTFTGQSTFPSGNTPGAPPITFSGATNSGIYFNATMRVSVAGTGKVNWGATGYEMASDYALQWNSATNLGGSVDTALGRLAAGSAGMTTGRWSVKQGAAVASANDLTLGSDGNRFQITGTTQINRILNTGWQGGSEITLHFQGAVTVTHNTASGSSFQGIMLAGAVSFVASANDQLVLQYDSTDAKWYEIGRAII